MYNSASKFLGDILEDYDDRNERLDFFLVINKVQLLLNHISLLDIK